jgi:ParB family chromosome partitioning protein
MLSSLRKENRATLGFDTQSQPTDEEKADTISSLTGEQKDVIRRDFIIKHLSDTYGDCKQSHLLLEFASLHFPVKVREIKELYNEVYKKRHTRIEERIRQLQPFTDNPEPETVETDDIPPYHRLPEHAYVGDIPQEEEELLNTVDDEPAA